MIQYDNERTGMALNISTVIMKCQATVSRVRNMYRQGFQTRWVATMKNEKHHIQNFSNSLSRQTANVWANTGMESLWQNFYRDHSFQKPFNSRQKTLDTLIKKLAIKLRELFFKPYQTPQRGRMVNFISLKLHQSFISVYPDLR